MPTTLLLTLALLLGPPAGQPAPAANAETYPALLAEITRITELLNEGEQLGDDLEHVLERLSHHAPRLAADEANQQLRTNALLTLARARLLAGEHAKAEATMDEVIRLAHGQTIELTDYGPALQALYDERRATMTAGGAASIQIVCSVPCSAYIDEQVSSLDASQLPLGVHRVWIEATTAGSGAAPQIRRVQLDSPGTVVRVTYSPEGLPPSEPHPEPEPQLERRPLAYAGFATVGVGILGTILGASLWGPYGKSIDPSIDVYTTHDLHTPGTVLIAVGVAASAIGISMLAVDFHRHRRHTGKLVVQATPGYAGLRLRASF